MPHRRCCCQTGCADFDFASPASVTFDVTLSGFTAVQTPIPCNGTGFGGVPICDCFLQGRMNDTHTVPFLSQSTNLWIYQLRGISDFNVWEAGGIINIFVVRPGRPSTSLPTCGAGGYCAILFAGTEGPGIDLTNSCNHTWGFKPSTGMWELCDTADGAGCSCDSVALGTVTINE